MYLHVLLIVQAYSHYFLCSLHKNNILFIGWRTVPSSTASDKISSSVFLTLFGIGTAYIKILHNHRKHAIMC